MSWLSSAISNVGSAVSSVFGGGGGGGSAPVTTTDSSGNTGVNWGGVAANVLSGLGGAAVGAGTVLAVQGTSGARRRRRRRRYPTAAQWARYEMANDMLTGHPNATAMKKQLSWAFFRKYSWM